MGIRFERDEESNDDTEYNPRPPKPSLPIPPINYRKRCAKIKDDVNKKFPRSIVSKTEIRKPKAPLPLTTWRPEHKTKELDIRKTIGHGGALIPGKTTVRTRYREIEPRKPVAGRRGNLGILIDESGSMSVGGGTSNNGYVSGKWEMAMKCAMGFVNMAEMFEDMVTIALYQSEGRVIYRRSRDYNLMHQTLCNMTDSPRGITAIWNMGIQYIWLDAMAAGTSTNVIISDGIVSTTRPMLKFNKLTGKRNPNGTYEEFKSEDVEMDYKDWGKQLPSEVMEGEYYIREMLTTGPVIVILMHAGARDSVYEAMDEATNIFNHPNFMITATWANDWDQFSKDIKPQFEKAAAHWLKPKE